MAKRFIRNVKLETCGEAGLDSRAEALRALVAAAVQRHFHGRGWQETLQGEANLHGVAVIKSSFRGLVDVHRTSDVIVTPQQGAQRQVSVRVSAQCANTRTEEARAVTWGLHHQVGGACGLLLGVLFAVAWAVLEGVLVGRVHLAMLVIAFCIGFGIGAAIGSMIGDKLGAARNAVLARPKAGEEDAVAAAAAEWEQFVGTLVTEVDTFAKTVESTPSSATLI